MNEPSQKAPIIFATFAESAEQIQHVCYLAESIREFAGKMKNAPVRLYVADYGDINLNEIIAKFKPLKVEIIPSSAPEEAFWLYYTGKVFAAGLAEKEAEGQADILVWMDDDTVIFQEPGDFLLAPNISLAYRPVMHNRSGSLYDAPPDSFWSRIYNVLDIKDESLFPMITVADKQKIRAYFNAGLLVVRPEYGILRKWGIDFRALYQDTTLANMCWENTTFKIFLHQTALVGAVLNTLKRDELIELPEKYNYPLFFEQMLDATRQFGSIADVITLRYDVYFRNPDPEWGSKLEGPVEKINWLRERLGK